MWPYRHYFDDPRKRRSAKPQFRGVQREKAPKTNARRSPRTVVFLQNCPKSLQARKAAKPVHTRPRPTHPAQSNLCLYGGRPAPCAEHIWQTRMTRDATTCPHASPCPYASPDHR